MNLFENPFCILGVSSRDSRKRIAEAAEEKSFLDDSESVREAQNVLTIPGRRLAAELRWFPGIDDEQTRGIIEFFRRIKARRNPGRIDSSGFRGLALLNFAVSVFSFRKFRDASEIEEAVLVLCWCFDSVSVEGICKAINNDRLIAGFTQADENDIVRELNDYRTDILGMIDGKLSALPENEYSGLAVRLAEKYSGDGGKSFLLGDIISAFELRILPRLEELAEIIIDTDSDVKLSFTLREWKRLARPLIIAAKATGIENTNLRTQAEEIFYAMREKAITLHNEHNKTREALNLILMLKEYVADISTRLLEMANKDIKELEDIERRQQEAEKEHNKWTESQRRESVITMITPSTESTEILARLRKGDLLFFGGIKVKDNGVYLQRYGWSSYDVKFFTWQEITAYSNNGMFIIEAGEYSASSSYINDMNTHILEAILQKFLRNPPSKRLRLSNLLNTP